MRALAALLALVALTLALPAGVALAPAPTTSISVALPPGPVNLPLGAQHDIPLKITFTAVNFGCTQDATVKVPITVMGSPSELASVTARPSITEAKFTIPSGVYQDAAAAAGSGPYNKSIEATLTIMVGTDAPANHQHAFQVTAAYNGGTPTGCQAVSDLPKASGMAKHQLVTGSTAPGDATMGTMNGAEHAQMTGQSATTSTPPPTSATKQTPGSPVLLSITLVAALVTALRKRA